jgi:ADP-ribosylglycohydrolase
MRERIEPKKHRRPPMSDLPVVRTPSLRAMLRPKFRGALLGAAVGDALGFPFEGSSRSFMAALGPDALRAFEAHRSGYFPAGQFADATQLTLATVESIIESQGFSGPALAASFLPLWRENRIIGRSPDCTEAVGRLIARTADWRTSGCEEGRAGNGAAKRAIPLGLWNYDEPERLVEETVLAAEITHRDRRAVAGAVAVATAVAYSLTHRDVVLGEWIDAVTGAIASIDDALAEGLRQLPRLLSLGEREAVREIGTIGGAEPDATPLVIESVMTAFYWFLRHPDDWSATVGGCLRSGGATDTIASIGGGISAAFHGVEAIPAGLRKSVVEGDRILQLADRLHTLKEGGRAPAGRRRG